MRWLTHSPAVSGIDAIGEPRDREMSHGARSGTAIMPAYRAASIFETRLVSPDVAYVTLTRSPILNASRLRLGASS